MSPPGLFCNVHPFQLKPSVAFAGDGGFTCAYGLLGGDGYGLQQNRHGFYTGCRQLHISIYESIEQCLIIEHVCIQWKEKVHQHSSVFHLYQFYRTSTDVTLRKKVRQCPQTSTPDPAYSRPNGSKCSAAERGSVFPLSYPLVWKLTEHTQR